MFPEFQPDSNIWQIIMASYKKNSRFLHFNTKQNFNTMKEKLLKAMYLAQKGDWNAAHEIVKDMENEYACWVHGYLHRKEPDLNNAAYWYLKARKPMPRYSHAREWQEIFEYLSNPEFKIES